MRKILTLMSTFALGSVMITPVVACTNQQQDSTLKAISNGNNQYNGWELAAVGISKPVGEPIKDKKPEVRQTINKDALQNNLAQALATLILDEANIKTPLWFTSSLTVGTQCYYFTIDNGILDEATGNRTWEVAATTGKISIAITYQLGVVSNDKTFKVEQYITKTFDVKCFYTQSDYIVFSCVKDVIALPQQTVVISVDDKSKPTVGKVYTDFVEETKTAIWTGIKETLVNNPYFNTISISIKGIDGEKVTENNKQWQLKVNFVISFQDSVIDMSLPSPYDNQKFSPTILQFTAS